MRSLLAVLALAATAASAQQPFTLQQILSAPYSTNLTAAPVGNTFAWVEHTEGRNNLWVAAPGQPARQLTHNTQDDAQDITSLAWSPDGSAIAFVYGAQIGNSGKPANPAHLQRPTPLEIYLQPVPGGEAIRLGEGRAPLFMPDGKTLLFLRSGQIFSRRIAPAKPSTTAAQGQPLLEGVLSLIGSVPTPDTAKQLVFDRGNASGLTLSPDGTKLAYVSHRSGHSFIALFDIPTHTLTFPAPSTGRDFAPSFSRDGKMLAWLRYPFTDADEFAGERSTPNPWSIQLLTLATNTTRTLFSPEANKPGSVEPRLATGEPHVLWAANNQLLFFSEADGWVHLYSIDPATVKPPVLLTSNVYEVEDPILSKDGKEVFFSANGPLQIRMPAALTKTGKSELRDTPAVYADRRSLFKIDLTEPSPKEQLYEACCSIFTHPQVTADGTMAALVSDELVPMHPEFVDFAKGSEHTNRQHILLHPEPFSGEKRVWGRSQPSQLLFKSADGLPLHGQIFMPPFDSSSKAPVGKHPAILFFHGGPKRQMLLGYPSMDYYSNAYAMNQYLASRGYIVLSVNYRGGIGYGIDFRQCQHCGADGAAEYADALGAAAYLRSRPDVDTAHIGIWGGSYGGYFTALALARNSDIFAAGVDFHGVHEWAREDNAPADWLRSPTNDPAEISKLAIKAHASSPMADVAKWRSPILLIHGDDDPEVAYAQTPLLADALRARGVPVEELIFPDELHGFLLHRDWLAAYEATAAFFDRMLKPISTTNSH